MPIEPRHSSLPAFALLSQSDDWVALSKPSGMDLRAIWESLRVSLAHGRGGANWAGLRSAALMQLEVDVSGLVALPISPAARRLARAAVGRGVRYGYLAIVGTTDLRRGDARLRSEGILDTEVVEEAGEHALVRWSAATGSSDTLRRRLARAGVPIVGDTENGGAPCWRPMLHLEVVRFEHGDLPLPAAPLPEDWRLLLSPPQFWSARAVRARLLAAASGRRRLASRANAYRLVNGAGDGLLGITVDQFAEWAVLSIEGDMPARLEADCVAALMESGARGVYAKRRVRADLRRQQRCALAPSEPVAGDEAPEAFVVAEGALKLWVSLGEGLSCGLFVDQRENRARLNAMVKLGQKVLNLFSYTCSFSVAAALAGARTTSVDLAGPALDWGRRNFELNGIDPSSHEFVKADAVRWLRGARRHQRAYDVVVLDPPSFSTSGRRGTFSVAKDYLHIATDALALLASGGWLLAVTNHRKTPVARLQRTLEAAAASAGRRVLRCELASTPMDCPALGGQPSPSKSFWVKVA